MANVIVETDTLKNGGEYVQKVYDSIALNYNEIENININVPSYKAFKDALADKNEDFKSHSDTFKNKITNCANDLETIDSSIGKMLTIQSEQLKSEQSTESAKVVPTANYSLSDNLD